MVDPPHRNTLNNGDTLERGQSLVSQNGLFRLTMQQDGNVVLYGPTADPARGPNGTAMWSSETHGSNSRRLEIEFGQLKTESDKSNDAELYKNKDGWSAPIPRDINRNLRLRLEDNGNLVLYNVVDNQPVWSSNTQVYIDPNRVILIHPDGEDVVVNAAVNAAQRVLQDSVDLFGPLGGTVPPPLMNDLISLGLVVNPDLTDKNDIGRGTEAYNKTAISLNKYTEHLIDLERDLTPKIKKIDDANQSTLRKIKAEIEYLNDAMRSARPPVETDSGASGKKRFFLSDSDTQAVLRIIGDSTDRVAAFVNQCQTQNINAAPTITQPEPPRSSAPPATNSDHSGDDHSGDNGSDNDQSGAAASTPTTPAPPATPPTTPATPVQHGGSPENVDKAPEPTGTDDAALTTSQGDDLGTALATDADDFTDPTSPGVLGLEDKDWSAFDFDGSLNNPFAQVSGPDLDTAVLLHALFGSPGFSIDAAPAIFQGMGMDRLFEQLRTDPLIPSYQPFEQLIAKGFPAATGLPEIRPDRMPTVSAPQTVTPPPLIRPQRLPGITAPTILKWVTSALKLPIATGPGNTDPAVEGASSQPRNEVVITDEVPGRGHDR
ncbi:hypothetical protein ACWEO2_06965 [Nocardia sp. NPDC004278]